MRFRLIPRDRGFYPLFEQAAATLLEAAQRLHGVFDDFTDVQSKHREIKACESRGDDTTREILRRLNSTYVTPFDREDIHALAEKIDDVLDTIQATSDLLVLHNITEPLPEMGELAIILQQASEHVVTLMGKLEALRGLEPELEAIDTLESAADAVYRRTVAKLFSGDYKPRDILRWKDVVESLEESVNQVEDISNIVETIVLKHA